MGALAGAVMFGAPAAFASTDASLSTSDAQTLCTKLSDQYQFLKPFKEGLPYWQTAKADYKEGKTDCKAGDPVKGAHAMQAAISDLYVKPDTL
jgi:hypothetical protein